MATEYSTFVKNLTARTTEFRQQIISETVNLNDVFQHQEKHLDFINLINFCPHDFVEQLIVNYGATIYKVSNEYGKIVFSMYIWKCLTETYKKYKHLDSDLTEFVIKLQKQPNIQIIFNSETLSSCKQQLLAKINYLDQQFFKKKQREQEQITGGRIITPRQMGHSYLAFIKTRQGEYIKEISSKAFFPPLESIQQNIEQFRMDVVRKVVFFNGKPIILPPKQQTSGAFNECNFNQFAEMLEYFSLIPGACPINILRFVIEWSQLLFSCAYHQLYCDFNKFNLPSEFKILQNCILGTPGQYMANITTSNSNVNNIITLIVSNTDFSFSSLPDPGAYRKTQQSMQQTHMIKCRIINRFVYNPKINPHHICWVDAKCKGRFLSQNMNKLLENYFATNNENQTILHPFWERFVEKKFPENKTFNILTNKPKQDTKRLTNQVKQIKQKMRSTGENIQQLTAQIKTLEKTKLKLYKQHDELKKQHDQVMAQMFTGGRSRSLSLYGNDESLIPDSNTVNLLLARQGRRGRSRSVFSRFGGK